MNSTSCSKRGAPVPVDPLEDLPTKRLRGGGAPVHEEDLYIDDDDVFGMADQPEEMEPTTEVFTDITPAMRQKWVRPSNQCKDNSKDLSLQWFDMDMMAGTPLEENPSEQESQVVGSTTGQVPIIRAYGVSDAGNSVTVFIHGFTPYGYFALPPNATFENNEENLTNIRLLINNRLEAVARGAKLDEYCRAVSFDTSRKSIMGYESPHTQFLKVHVAMPTLIPALKRIMEEGIDLPGVTLEDEGNSSNSPFECNVPFVLRYMVDQDIDGAGWLTLPAKTYQVRPIERKNTHCQVRSRSPCLRTKRWPSHRFSSKGRS